MMLSSERISERNFRNREGFRHGTASPSFVATHQPAKSRSCQKTRFGNFPFVTCK